ncbi:MAG: TetR/AcrR family transcriptional regulator [Methylophilus sp.]
MDTNTTTRTLGRPRKFDKDRALDTAMRVFMQKGYEATSITDITEALGINRPSVYAAFGNKEALFAQALTRYIQGPIAYLGEVLSEKTSRDVVRELLMKSVELMISCAEQPRGCLAVQSSISSELAAAGIQQHIVNGLSQIEINIKNRFDRAIDEGDLPKDTDSWLLTKYVTTLHKGLSIQATNGTSEEELRGIVEIALKCWPGK